MKSDILNVRIPQKIKNLLNTESDQLGINLSDNIRDILSNHCYKNNTQNLTIDAKLYNSNEFLFLITWLIDKRNNNYNNNNIEVLVNIKKVIYKVINDSTFPDYIRSEFEKVHNDLSKYIENYGAKDNRFTFCVLYTSECFDYTGLFDYIYIKAFENRIKL